MSLESPFSPIFQVFGHNPGAHVDEINRSAFQKIVKILSVPLDHVGRCVMLSAPRAGFGKTHLLNQVRQKLLLTHDFVLIVPDQDSRVDASVVLLDVLRSMTERAHHASGLTALDRVARTLLAMSLEPLVESGEVPSDNRESALRAMRQQPVETFDFHDSNAITAHWIRDHFQVLGPRLIIELAQRFDLPLKETAMWIEALFDFAITPLFDPVRVGRLLDAVTQAPNVAAQDCLHVLLRLMSSMRRVVLVADELEGLSTNEEGALRFASFVNNLRHGSSHIDVVLAVNDDLWNNAFTPRLTGGLQDRLTEYRVRLKPLTREQIEKLIDSRAPGMSELLLAQLDLDENSAYARAVLRAATEHWDDVIHAEDVNDDVNQGQIESVSSVDELGGVADDDAHDDAESETDDIRDDQFADDVVRRHFDARVSSHVTMVTESQPIKSVSTPDAKSTIASPFRAEPEVKIIELDVEKNVDDQKVLVSPFKIADAPKQEATPVPRWTGNAAHVPAAIFDAEKGDVKVAYDFSAVSAKAEVPKTESVAVEPAVVSPFMVAPSSESAAASPVVASSPFFTSPLPDSMVEVKSQEPSETKSPFQVTSAAAVDSTKQPDKVDELLKKFRDRFGKTS